MQTQIPIFPSLGFFEKEGFVYLYVYAQRESSSIAIPYQTGTVIDL
jgi:hypothetical protein